MKSTERVSFSPGEFAALFGKSQTWGYRQIYAGKVTTITEFGRIQIPAAEVERILATAGPYNGAEEEAAALQDRFQSFKPELQTAWRAFLLKKREGGGGGAKNRRTIPSPRSNARKAALARLPSGKQLHNKKPR